MVIIDCFQEQNSEDIPTNYAKRKGNSKGIRRVSYRNKVCERQNRERNNQR